MNNKQEHPLILTIEEAKNELVQSVNSIMQKYKLPCYFIEPIFKDIYMQLQNEAKNELEMAKAQFKESIKGAE